MSNKLIKYKFRNEYFAGYGLNKFKNFMSPPECECGCGGKVSIILNDREELFGFMGGMLEENDCDCCAIFAHTYDDKMYAAVKLILDGEEYDEEYDEEDTGIQFYGLEKEDLEFFQQVDSVYRLHCYGLMIETKKGQWKIIED